MDYSKNKNFCVMPFTHMEIAPRGKASPCCAFKHQELFSKEDEFGIPSPNVNKINLTTIFEKHAHWEKSRHLSLKNEINPACVQCHMEEKAGTRSYREYSNEKFLKYIDIDNERHKLLSLELKLGAKCNIACRMCSSQHSNKLLKEDSINIFGKIDKNWIRHTQTFSDWATSDNFWNQIYDISKDLKYIKFTGGEPLIIHEHFQYLDWLSKNNLDPEISYITNGTVPLTESIKNTWKKFSQVQINISIDSVEEIEEYIRTGTVWEEKVKNIRDYADFLGFNNVNFTITINSFSVNSVDRIVEWLNELGFDNKFGVSFNILVYPHHMDIRNLPDNAKDHINYKLNNLINTNRNYPDYIINGIKNIQNSMNRPRNNKPCFISSVLKQEENYKLANKKEMSFEKIEPQWFNIIKEGESC